MHFKVGYQGDDASTAGCPFAARDQATRVGRKMRADSYVWIEFVNLLKKASGSRLARSSAE